MADTLAIWAYGSLEAYAAAANQFLAQNGLTGTRVGSDASGLAASTTSTAKDLVKLGTMAMQNPVLAQIVGQPKADGFPVVNSIKNVNDLIGMNGIIGIKTGNSDEAGGVFVSASQITVNGKPQVIVTAVMGAPTLFASMKDSLALIKSAQANFKPVKVVEANQVITSYKVPWGGSVKVIAAQALSTNAWQGSPVETTIKLYQTDRTPVAYETVGQLSAAGQSINLQLADNPSKPSILWRLTHAF
jgi:D-alanyl-D-alanine carboxypeptidase (penicillin-binding protein 5/6)